MSTISIRHYDTKESMEEIARYFFGQTALITSKSGHNCEMITEVTNCILTDDDVMGDIESMDYVISVEILD